MFVSLINNTSFQAHIKMAKPNISKLAKGAVTISAGAASLYTGLEITALGPDSLAGDIYRRVLDEQLVATPEGFNPHIEANENSADGVASAMFMSAPLGATVTSAGYKVTKNSFKEDNSLNKNIPN